MNEVGGGNMFDFAAIIAFFTDFLAKIMALFS